MPSGGRGERPGIIHPASTVSPNRHAALCREAWAGSGPGGIWGRCRDHQGLCRDHQGLCWVTPSGHFSAVPQFPNLHPKANLSYQQCQAVTCPMPKVQQESLQRDVKPHRTLSLYISWEGQAVISSGSRPPRQGGRSTASPRRCYGLRASSLSCLVLQHPDFIPGGACKIQGFARVDSAQCLVRFKMPCQQPSSCLGWEAMSGMLGGTRLREEGSCLQDFMKSTLLPEPAQPLPTAPGAAPSKAWLKLPRPAPEDLPLTD